MVKPGALHILKILYMKNRYRKVATQFTWAGMELFYLMSTALTRDAGLYSAIRINLTTSLEPCKIQ